MFPSPEEPVPEQLLARLLVPSEDPSTAETPATFEKRWLRLLRETNFSEIASYVYAEEKDRGWLNERKQDSMPKEVFWKLTRQLLASMRPSVLDTICWGNLTYARRMDTAVQVELDDIEDRNKNLRQPSICLWEFVNKNTYDALTPNQLIKIIVLADRYARFESDRDVFVVNRVDNYKHRVSMQETRDERVRKYLAGATQIEKYKELRNNMLALFREMTPEQMDRPLEQPIREVGYAEDSPTRIKQHKSHRGSNYLMNLFEAIAEMFFPDRFEMKAHIILLIWNFTQASVAEILFSVLGSAYTKTGLGFSHQPAGISVASVQSKNFDWHSNWNWVGEKTDYLARLEEDDEKLRVLKQQYDASPRSDGEPVDEEEESPYSPEEEMAMRVELAALLNEIQEMEFYQRQLDEWMAEAEEEDGGVPV